MSRRKTYTGWLRIVLLVLLLLTGCRGNMTGNGTAATAQTKVRETGTERETSEAASEQTVPERISTSGDNGKGQREAEKRQSRAEKKSSQGESPDDSIRERIKEDGSYSSKEEVAAYIHSFGKLPKNYITKEEATALGWDSREGNLWELAPGKSIGGSRFGNYEKRLPKGKYLECDIDYAGGHRNAKRIVFSADGRHVYYTEDHYESFETLY